MIRNLDMSSSNNAPAHKRTIQAEGAWIDQPGRRPLVRERVTTGHLNVELLDYIAEVEQDDILYLDGHCRLNIAIGSRVPRAKGRFLRAAQPQRDLSIGNLLFVPADEPIRLSCVPGHIQTLSCTFSLDHYRQVIGENVPVSLDLRRLSQCLDLRNVVGYRLMSRIIEELNTQTFGYQFAVESLAMLALVEVGRHFGAAEEKRQTGGLAGWQIKRVIARIHDDPALLPSIDELATLCRISPRHLMRGFRNTTGQTIGEVIRESQIAHAKERLLGTDLSVANIAAELGFSSPSNFTTAFRRSTGTTPSDFRRKAAETHR